MELEKEYQTYKANLEKLASEHLHEFVLIKNEEIVETFKSYEDALKFGLKRFGNVPFFIRKIERDEEMHFFYQGVVG